MELTASRTGGSLEKAKTKKLGPDRTVWAGGSGWFSAAYGPFRRFSGGDRDYDRLFFSNPRLAAHLTAFGEDVALTESIEWLKQLQFQKLEGHAGGALLDRIITFVNQGDFLPHDVQLNSVSSEGVHFIDPDERRIRIEDLSDGYRSILSMTFELIRQISQVYSAELIFDDIKIGVPGVVLIDEIDAHLHPTWQRRIGEWFTKHFPAFQFIVTTHSPIICRAAAQGTVWKLATPGTVPPTESSIRPVDGREMNRLVYGNVLEAYGTDLFGTDVTRSTESRELLQTLARLNRKEVLQGLSDQEREDQAKLRGILPTAANLNQLDA